MGNRAKRKVLFDTYSKNFSLVRKRYTWSSVISEEYNKAVICPVCLNFHSENKLIHTSVNPLTIEHLPPEALGGKPLILTCKDCNSTSGHTLDTSLIEYYKVNPFLKLEDKSKVKIPATTFKSTDKKILTSSATLEYQADNTLFFKLNIDKGSYREKIFETIPSFKEVKVDFVFHTPPIKFIQIALLRVAYLIAFSKFGNAFILNKVYNGIRQQILQPTSDVLSAYGAIKSELIPCPAGIYKINAPVELEGYFVVFTITYNKKEFKNGVFLPSPYIDSVEYYERFNEHTNSKMNLKFSDFLDVDYLTDSKYAFGGVEVFIKNEQTNN
jgi:hypothetical protein